MGFQSALKEKEEARGSWGKKPWLWGGKRALSATGSKREEIQAWIPPELKLIPFLGPFREIPSSSRPVLGGCGAFDGQLQNMASAAAQYIFMSCFKMTFLGKVSPAGASRSPDWRGRGGRHLAILWEKPRSHKAWAAALTLAPSSLRPQMRPLTSLNTPLVISETELSSIYPARVTCRGLLWAWAPSILHAFRLQLWVPLPKCGKKGGNREGIYQSEGLSSRQVY